VYSYRGTGLSRFSDSKITDGTVKLQSSGSDHPRCILADHTVVIYASLAGEPRGRHIDHRNVIIFKGSFEERTRPRYPSHGRCSRCPHCTCPLRRNESTISSQQHTIAHAYPASSCYAFHKSKRLIALVQPVLGIQTTSSAQRFSPSSTGQNMAYNSYKDVSHCDTIR